MQTEQEAQKIVLEALMFFHPTFFTSTFLYLDFFYLHFFFTSSFVTIVTTMRPDQATRESVTQ
jgi:hypothetical protein